MGSKCCGDAEAFPASVFAFFVLLAYLLLPAALSPAWRCFLFLAALGFFASVNAVFPVQG
jgi:hypothetical protein